MLAAFHCLCSDLHLAQVWNGWLLQLYTYLCRSLSVSFIHGGAWLTWSRDGWEEGKLHCSRKTQALQALVVS
jgi:hypothetical protein